MKKQSKFNMKKSFIILFFTLVSIQLSAQGLDSIIVERYYKSNLADSLNSVGVLPVGSVTYRIFVDMKPGYKFQAAYGNSDHELRMETTTGFFNNEDRGAVSPTYTKNQAKLNTVMLDSWISVGAGCTGNFGVLKSEDNGVNTVVNSDGILQNNDPLAGIPLTSQDGLMAGVPQPVTMVGIDNEVSVLDATSMVGNVFSTTNGAWSALSGAVGPTPTNRLLIAQITTNGIFSFKINIQIKDTVNNMVEQYVSSNPVGNEHTDPTLTFISNKAPEVNITSPQNGSVFTAGMPLNIKASANDTDGSITKVEFYLNGVKIGEDLTAPYQITWLGIAGIDTLTAVATDNMGTKTTSDSVMIYMSPVAVNQINKTSSNIRVYPNPSKDELMLEISSEKGYKSCGYTIYDMLGNEVVHHEIGTTTINTIDKIDISMLSKGTYLMKFTADTQNIMQIFIKN